MKPSLETCLLSVLASFGGKDKQQGQMPIYPVRVFEAVSFTVGPSQEVLLLERRGDQIIIV